MLDLVPRLPGLRRDHGYRSTEWQWQGMTLGQDSDGDAGRQADGETRHHHVTPARSDDAVVRIAISQAAFDAIASTLPLGSVGYENGPSVNGERLIWLAPNVVNRLRAMRGPGES